MPDRQRQFVYRPVPKRRPGVRPLLWVLVGFSILLSAASAWTIVLFSGSVASHHSFVGQLSPNADPTIVTLPQGAILKEVHIARGSQVRKGETLATLDIEAMERQIERLSAELLHDDTLRQCLLTEELPDSGIFVELTELAQEQARLARQDCENFLAEKSGIQTRLHKGQALVREEYALVTQYQRILADRLRGDLPPTQRDEESRQVLALSLLRNKLERQMANSQFDADKEGAEWQQRRLTRVRDLQTQIQQKIEMRHHINSLLETPRLQAPEDGLVVQIRRIQSDRPTHEMVDLVVLRPKNGDGYRANFEVPHFRLDAVSVGDRVQMVMLGMPDGGPLLMGRVSGLRTTGQTLVRAEVTLDPESTKDLDNPQIGIALRGLGTASVIRVQKEDQEALQVLKGVLTHSVFQPGETWFVKTLLGATNDTDDRDINLG